MQIKITKLWWSPLVLGVFILFLNVFIFAWLTDEVMDGDPLTIVDQQIHDWFMAHANVTMTRIMAGVSHLADSKTVYVMSAFVALILAWKRMWFWLFSLIFIVPGGLMLDELIKHAVQRPRPSTDVLNITLHSYSFPSGHALGSTLMYGFLSVLAYNMIPSKKWRNITISGLVFLIMLISLSRVYLGFHFPTDVLGGIAAGVIWLLLCFMSTHALFKMRQK
jgi:undecaprenyl-diphosphatase